MKLEKFVIDDQIHSITHVESMIIKDGVTCDVYSFDDDSTKDLGIVTVKPGFKTPQQCVKKGKTTVEGHISGVGTLAIWYANGDSDLQFSEVCSPPYEEGRFESITV